MLISHDPTFMNTISIVAREICAVWAAPLWLNNGKQNTKSS
jgi:hypothetical protein